MMEFIGKSILITEGKEKVLVVSDLHLGYGESLRRGGVFVYSKVYEEMAKDFEDIFAVVGKVDRVIILGDVKHEIGAILSDERAEVDKLFRIIDKWSSEIVIVKGNHDAMLKFILRREVKLVDYYIWKEYAFIHGDKDYDVIYDKKIKYWFIGHIHPAVNLREGIKEEKYKCFLVGDYIGKKVTILPSFFTANEGTDPREFEEGLPWKFKIEDFNVSIVNGMEILNFGKLKKL